MREELVAERSELLVADEARAVWRQHAGVVRERLGALPRQMAADLEGAFGLEEDLGERLRAIIAVEMQRVLEMVSDDPLANAAAVRQTVL